MTIAIWLVMYVILGILFAESIFIVMKKEEPSKYLAVKSMHKTIYGGLTCLWAPILVLAIIKLFLKGVFK